MKISIITPSIGRTSLYRTIQSVDGQYPADFEHIIAFDGQESVIEGLHSPPARIVCSVARRTGDYGNTPRHVGSIIAKGAYVMYLDDDDYLFNGALRLIELALAEAKLPDVAVFPAMRLGEVWTGWPPGPGHLMSCQWVHKAGIARWPAGNPDYLSDWHFFESVSKQYPPVRLNIKSAMVCVDQVSHGK